MCGWFRHAKWAVGIAAVSLPAQQVPDAARRTAAVGRVAEAAAPAVDGIMTDECWRTAPPIGDLTMVEPWEGRSPTQRTEVRLLHDRHNLYIGLWCFDTDAASIRASQRSRDALLDPDDRVEILLDPFENRRTAYFFQIGAGGSIGDILITENGSRFDKPWDAIWSGASRVTDEGWFAEMAIPFRSIPRREGATRWGFNLTRFARAHNEEYRWANPTQAVSFYRASECGTIDGFGAVDGGIGVELVPYVAASVRRDRSAADRGWSSDPDAGGEAYYRVTPSVTLATTVYTDFAETESDGRQINLNRFPLFFPEKRDFFLEGLGYFTFGATEAGGSMVIPFFTRRVGLAPDGTEIPLIAGAKLTGEAGPFEIGILGVRTDETATVDVEDLATARIKYALGAQTTVGFVSTVGDPTSGGDNTVAGVDFYHRQPRWLGDLDLQIVVDALASTGDPARDGESFGAEATARGREWRFTAGTRWVTEDFDAALGFVRRQDTRATSLFTGYRPRLAEGGSLRALFCDVSLSHSDSWEGEPQDLGARLDGLGAETHAGDEAGFFAERRFERVDSDFTLFDGTATIFAGDYWTSRGGVFVGTSQGRPWNAELVASTGDFFDGRSDEVEVVGEWRTSALLSLGGSYETAIVDLGPARSFTARIASARLDLHFTSSASLFNLVQFDNESNVLGWQSRLRWTYAPGCDVFAVLGSNWERQGDESLVPTAQTLELKIAHSIRF